MAQEKDNKKKTSGKSNNKTSNTKKTTSKEVVKKESKLAKIGSSIVKSYEEPKEDKAAAIKAMMEKEDSPIVKKSNEYKTLVITFIVGLVLGLIIMALFIPDRIATLADGQQVIVEIGDKNITSDDLYKDLKEHYSISLLVDKIDDMILSEMYPEDNDMKTAVNETADYYISMYETYYNYTEEQFLESNGFSSRDAFITYLTLDYRRNEYYTEYVKKSVTEKEIKSYYDSEVFGDISTKYISIDTTDDAEAAKELVDEILEELEEGKTYDDIISKYKDEIKYEDLGYISFNSDLEDSYISALRKLKDDSYTTEAVENDNDYKIIFRVDQKEKQSQEEVQEQIVENIASEKQADDSTLYYKALDTLRKENSVSIKDTELAKKYEDYIKENTTADTTSDTTTN